MRTRQSLSVETENITSGETARQGATAPPGLAELARLSSRTRAGPISGYRITVAIDTGR
jgi:hypothetical protein